jgi:hypothetical protein
MFRRLVQTAVTKVFGTAASNTDQRPARQMPLPELLAEDLATHDRELWTPGFWGIAAHRLAARAPAAPALLRGPSVLAARLFATGVDYVWGIHVTPTTGLVAGFVSGTAAVFSSTRGRSEMTSTSATTPPSGPCGRAPPVWLVADSRRRCP